MFDKKELALNNKTENQILYSKDCRKFDNIDSYQLLLDKIKSEEQPQLYEYTFKNQYFIWFLDIEIKLKDNPEEYAIYMNIAQHTVCPIKT